MKKLLKTIVSAAVTAALAVTTAVGGFTAQAAGTSEKTASQLVKEIKVGWNLGNTLEATGDSSLNSETYWGNPKTTKAMIDAVKAAGFDSVRIPVSWGQHTSGSSYTIDSAWMARVKEVVDYCIDNDMYVILNTHHDTASAGQSGAYYYPSNDYLTQSETYLTAVWTQIANEFESYDYHLIFETLNEPRLVGTDNEWWGNWAGMNDEVSEAISCINAFNQTSLDAIRATGGNNAQRCVMVPGYAASIDGATADDFELPTDSATDRLIVSVHAYTPYNFALNGSGTSTFSDSLKKDIDSLFTSINTKFLSKGIPVIIGEMGASNKSNSDDRVKWVEYYLTKAKQYVVPCLLWDNNVYEGKNKGECHGHLNRSTLTWYEDSFIQAIMDTMGITSDLPDDSDIYPDISTLNLIWSGSAQSSSWGQAVALTTTEFGLTSMSDDVIIAVRYSGQAPELIVQGGDSTHSIWSKNTGYGQKNGVAYYKLSDIKSAYASDYKSSYGSEPSSAFQGAYKVYIGDTGGSMTVTEIRGGTASTEEKTSISGATVTCASQMTYTGSALKPTVTVKLGTKTLTSGTDYTVSYSSNTNAGKAIVTVTGKGGYTGTASASFIIIPANVTGIKATSNGETSVTLSWTKNSQATGYVVYQSVNGVWTRVKVTASNTATVTGLKQGTDYSFTVKAYKTISNKNYYCPGYTAYKTTTLPAVPTMKLSSNTASSVTLSWNKLTGATGYVVYKMVDGNWERIKVTSSNSLTVTGLGSGTTYNFTVRAYKTFGGKNYYCPTYKKLSVTTLPAAVKMSLSKSYETVVSLSWNKAAGATGYVVYQEIGGKWERIKVTSANSLTVTGLKSATTYKFTVRAYKTLGGVNYYSPSFTALTVSTLPSAAKVTSFTSPSSKAVKAVWDKVSGATGYQIQISPSKTFASQNKTYVQTALTKTVTGLTAKTTYYVRVRAYRTVDGVNYYGSWSAVKYVAAKA